MNTGRDQKVFFYPKPPVRVYGLPSFLFEGYRSFVPHEVKQPGRDVDHSPPSSAEAKNEWSYILLLPYAIKAWYWTAVYFMCSYVKLADFVFPWS